MIRAILALLLVTSACAPAPGAPPSLSAPATVAPAVKLVAPYTAISVVITPEWVAKEKGLFEKEGLDVDMPYVATSTNLVASMVSGEVQLACSGQEAVISADLGGADIVIIASGPQRLLFSIYATSAVGSLKDLKGKRLGVTRTGASTDFAARFILNKNGLEPGKDVALIAVGGVPEILAALKSGAIDAGVLSPPTTFAAKRAGFTEIVDIAKEDLPFYQAPIVARRSWLERNRDVAMRFLRAYVAAVALVRKDPSAAAPIVGKYTKETDAEVLSASIAAILPSLPLDQTPRLDAVKAGLDQAALTNAKAKDADPKQFIDASLMTDLIRSGFLDTLR